MPIANTASPIPSTTGMTSGRFTTPDREQQDHAEHERGQPAHAARLGWSIDPRSCGGRTWMPDAT